MKRDHKPYATLQAYPEPNSRLFIQAPLPDFNNTLPILITVPGQGTERERSAPLAPPGRPHKREPHHDTH